MARQHFLIKIRKFGHPVHRSIRVYSSRVLVVMVVLIRWQMRFNNIITDDPDYPKAKKHRTVAFIL